MRPSALDSATSTMRSALQLARGLVFGVALALLARHARADVDPPAVTPPVAPPPGPRDGALRPLVWDLERFSALDFAITAAGGAIMLTSAIVHPRSQHSLSGGVWFDEDVRDALRHDSAHGRYVFRDASDVGLSLTVTWPFVADSLVTAYWYRGNRDAAEQMALIDMQALAVAGAIQGVTNVLVSRERPFGRLCGSSELPADAHDCEGSIHYRSFFSGHSAFSFTGASLICVHHVQNELLGAPWDALSCAGGYTVAAATASFRLVSDVHYATDVITGALLGTIVGWGVPLLHYRTRGAAKPRVGTELLLVPAAGGLGVMGSF